MSIHPLGPRPGRRLAERRAAAAGGGRPGGAASPAAPRGDRRPVVAGQGAATRMADPWEKVGETHGNLEKPGEILGKMGKMLGRSEEIQ